MPQPSTHYLVFRKSIPETFWEEKNSGMVHTKNFLPKAGPIGGNLMVNNKSIAGIEVGVA
ncbi:MAG: hypothetical protein AB9883_00865 [Acidaminococcaceae bacterium]